MTRLLKLGVCYGLIVFFISGRAIAAQEKIAASQTYAIIVGVGEFQDAKLKPRRTAETDAKALYDVFTDKAVGGVPTDHVQFLISGKDEERGAKTATRENILAAFKTLVGKATKDDRIVVAWVGQGASVGDRTCLFAANSTFKDRAKNAITAADLAAEWKKVKAKEVVALLDFDLKAFEAGKEQVLEPDLRDVVRMFLGQKEKDDAEPPAGRVVILANFGTAPAVTVEGKEGIFTKAVVAGLRGAADKEGYEPDGVVTVDELTKYLESAISDLAREHGKTEESKQQTPGMFARSSHYILSKNPAVTSKVEERLKKLDSIGKTEKFKDEVTEQGRRLLSQMPKLKALQDLRKDYQQLADGKLGAKEFLEARVKLLDGMTLNEDAAKSYAQKLMRGFEEYKAAYIKDLSLGEMTAEAIKGLYARADQKLAPEFAVKLAKANELPKSGLIDLLKDSRLPLGKREDFEKDRDVEIALQLGIAKFVDRHTLYVDREKVSELDKEVQGFFTGIGVLIRRDVVKDALLVISPIKGSPAYKAGLKAGDFITSIRREVDGNGKKLDPAIVTSTKGLKVQDAVKVILGKPGTNVKINVERPGETSPLEFEIARGLVEVETVLGYKRKNDDSWDYFIDPKSKIAYLHLTQFSRNSFYDMDKAVKKIEKDGAKGLIVDVRFNPGGYLDVARDICDLFIDDGLIVTIRPRVGEEYSMIGRHESVRVDTTLESPRPDYPFGSHTNLPMVCLVNGDSASASEILSACLQDHHRAIIMGERSYGKGSVQHIRPFKATGGEIKMTTATFWRPNGKNLNKASTKGTDAEDWGVRPDKNYAIKLDVQEAAQLYDRIRDWANIPNREAEPKEPAKEFKDRQLDAAVAYLRDQAKLMPNKTAKKSD